MSSEKYIHIHTNSQIRRNRQKEKIRYHNDKIGNIKDKKNHFETRGSKLDKKQVVR